MKHPLLRRGYVPRPTCDRCGYDEAECGDDGLPEPVPDGWADRYLALCKHCQTLGNRYQDKLEGGADYDR